MKFKNSIMLLSFFLIFTSIVGCLSWDFGNGLKFDFKSGKIKENAYSRRGHTYARGDKRCTRLKEVCNDVRYIKGCEYKEWKTKPLFGEKFKECICTNVKLTYLP